MKLIHQLPAFLFTASADVWKEEDLIGTFKAVGPGRHEFAEIHFGLNEVLIKRKEGSNVGSNVIMGHWYTSGEEAVIWEGKPGSKDQKARIENLTKDPSKVPKMYPTKVDNKLHLEVNTVDTITYHCTTFVRAKKPTDLDTLAMVRYGRYVASASKSTISRAVFTEGKMALVYNPELQTPNKHGKWEVKVFDKDSVDGILTVKKSQEEVKVHIEKVSENIITINCERLTLDKN
ncbi:hypothetical protein DSO57_1032076 [Entomophthora muscae]|uniref:Uncharacterized protein n=1 Tax=Entomophthora muscae TaxID=34485 RepID=A0ACC2U9Y8_9FUNG|nr:hypothetical protein DSO57_1032076 [Entomophthora muscae]